MCKRIFASLFTAAAVTLLATGAMAGEAQVVILDECDPNTFNLALGNVATANIPCVGGGPPGGTETLPSFLSHLPSGDPLWDYEPDVLTVREGDTVRVTNEGGEIHTLTQVARFGNGFNPLLNNPTGATNTIPECQGGFSKNGVAATRVVHGASSVVTGLTPGKHLFECCIHPWMRMEIDVQGKNE